MCALEGARRGPGNGGAHRGHGCAPAETMQCTRLRGQVGPLDVRAHGAHGRRAPAETVDVCGGRLEGCLERAPRGAHRCALSVGRARGPGCTLGSKMLAYRTQAHTCGDSTCAGKCRGSQGPGTWVLTGTHDHTPVVAGPGSGCSGVLIGIRLQRQHACGWVGALTELTNSPLGMRFRDCVFRALRIVHWHSQRTILRDRVGILGISWASPSNPLTSGSGNLNLFVATPCGTQSLPLSQYPR